MDLLVRSGGLTAAMLQQHCVTAGSGGLDRGAHRVFTLRDERDTLYKRHVVSTWSLFLVPMATSRTSNHYVRVWTTDLRTRR